MATRHPESVILTIGHSTRPLVDFVGQLKAHAVVRLIDVRTVPRSRHNPQYNIDTLPSAVADESIAYEHVAGLGGFRKTHPGSPNTGWRNASFRGYADYMQTAEFAEHLARLMEIAGQERVALMCAEAVPWRCHRSLIADALLVHGLRVEEITRDSQADTICPCGRPGHYVSAGYSVRATKPTVGDAGRSAMTVRAPDRRTTRAVRCPYDRGGSHRLAAGSAEHE